MRIKEKLMAAMAVITAAVSCTAVSAGAVTLGKSDDTGEIVFEFNNKAIELTADGELNKFTIELSEDSFPAGKYSLAVNDFIDADYSATLKSVLPEGTNVEKEFAFSIRFWNEKGETVSPKNVTVNIQPYEDGFFNAVYLVDESGLIELDLTKTDDGYSFTTPHCSVFVMAQLTSIGEPASSEIEDISKTDDTKKPTDTNKNSTPAPADDNVNTGDNADTTAAVFTVLSIVALMTAVAAVKRDKRKAQ